MRALSSIGAVFVLLCAATVGRAETIAAAPAAGSDRALAPPILCDGPGPMPRPHRIVRHHRHYVRLHYRHRRHWWPMPAALPYPPPAAVVPVYYNPPLPDPYDSAYDRAMTLHFRSPAVSGIQVLEPGFPPTPPIVPYQWYRVQAAGGPVLQYDGLTGQYIPLAQSDAAWLAVATSPPP